LDFNDDQATDKKPKKKKLTSFFDEPHSGDELPDDEIDDDDDASDIDMEITWQPGLKGKNEEKSKTINDQQQSKKNKKTSKKHQKAELLEHDYEVDPTENGRDALELLTVDDDIDGKRNYNLRDMIKSHKKSTKAAAKNAKKLKKSQQGLSTMETDEKMGDDDFRLNVNDKRFQALYTQPAFNIDPSDPHFKSTAGTQRLIDEKLRKRKFDNITSSKRTEEQEDDLVVKLKRKSTKKE